MSLNLVEVPTGAALTIREMLALGSEEQLRISYLSGTGDVVGTFIHWMDGRHDPRVPVITYSAMFYDIVQALSAHAQIITPWNSEGVSDPRFKFETIAREPSSGGLAKIVGELQYTQKCIAAINQYDPHIVVSNTDFQPLGWRNVKRKRRLILSAHNTFWPMGSRPSDLKSLAKLAIVKFQAAALDGAVCTSSECQRQIASVTRNRVLGQVEFPQLVDEFELNAASSARRLLYLGRIEASKGVFMLLDAFTAVSASVPGLSLTFAGTGTAEKELEEKIAATGSHDVRFVGNLDAKGVHAAIADSDLIVCPTMTTFNEGLALVGFEAAAHGVPSLVSSVVPAADLLGQGCMVFTADDSASLRRALASLTADAESYQRLKAEVVKIRPSLYDRSKSWGSMLLSAMMAA